MFPRRATQAWARLGLHSLRRRTSATPPAGVERVVDLRSDTLTKPSDGMRRAMADAEVGDDVFGEDPTVKELESRMAALLGKEAALFVPTGTMGNLVCVGAHCGRADEVILGNRSHIFLNEGGSPAALLSVSPHPLPNKSDGTLCLSAVEAAVRADDPHFPHTGLLALETTHNECGGLPLPLSYMADAAAVARRHGMPLHVDGARLFNAAAALGVPAGDVIEHADSTYVCLSKGLGCPVGSIVVGSSTTIAHARRLRKAFGGGMRQAGVLAAAGLYALDHVLPRLGDDHSRAARFADAVRASPHASVDSDAASGVPTSNIVWFHLDRACGKTVQQVVDEFAQRGVRILGGYAGAGDSADGTMRFRAVTHVDVDDADVDVACAAAREVLA